MAGFYYYEPILYQNNTDYEPIYKLEILVCFCDKHFNGIDTTEKNYSKEFEFKFDGKDMKEPICKDYFKQKWDVMMWDQITNLAINVMNFFIQQGVFIVFSFVSFPT
jgi:hypothetical protein